MNIRELLRLNGLKNTPYRNHILNELIKHNNALTEGEIKGAFSESFDRVTFYRSTKALEEKGLIHRIVLNDTTVKYAFNSEAITPKSHPHFHCTECDNVTCIDSDIISKTSTLPSGYEVQSAQVLIEGVCPGCSEKSK
jgi:Fe2+/Zn2+ uptake regulation proteins